MSFRWALALILAHSLAASAGYFHVATDGTPAGDGSADHPWDLATALAQPTSVTPGSLVQVHGGVYRGAFTSTLTGDVNDPIYVLPWPGDTVTFDCGTGGPALTLEGSYAWFTGFEVMSSDPHRVSTQPGAAPTDIARCVGAVIAGGPGLRVNHLVVHDVATGIVLASGASQAEAYGNIVYNVGWVGPDQGHGDGIVVGSANSGNAAVQNLMFDNFGAGLVTAATGAIDGIDFERNFAFMNGAPSGRPSANLVVGGAQLAHDPIVSTNCTYFSDGGTNRLGAGAGTFGLVAADNLFVSGGDLAVVGTNRDAGFDSNLFFGAPDDGGWPAALYSDVRPTGMQTCLVYSGVQGGLIFVAVYNWDLQDTVVVPLTAGVPAVELLAEGTHYDVRDAQNFHAGTLFSGDYSGAVTFPMTLTGVDPLIGDAPNAPVHTPREFAVFIIDAERWLPPVVALPDAGAGDMADAGDAGAPEVSDAGLRDAGVSDAGPNDAGSNATVPSDAGATADAGIEPSGVTSACGCQSAAAPSAALWLAWLCGAERRRRHRVRRITRVT